MLKKYHNTNLFVNEFNAIVKNSELNLISFIRSVIRHCDIFITGKFINFTRNAW